MKTYSLMTESVKNGVYHREQKIFTEKEFNNMLHSGGNMELESVTLSEKVEVINGKAYAVIALLGKKREINGCEARVENSKKLVRLEKEKASLKTLIDNINTQIIDCRKLDNELALAGYCLIDNPKYKKVDGIRIKDENGNYIIAGTTHADNCSHKEG